MSATDPSKFDLESALLGDEWLAFSSTLDAAEARRTPVDGAKIAEELTRHCRREPVHKPVQAAPAQSFVGMLTVAAMLLLTCNLVFPSIRSVRPKEAASPEPAVAAQWEDGLDDRVAAIADHFARPQFEALDLDSIRASAIHERIRALQAELLDDTL